MVQPDFQFGKTVLLSFTSRHLLSCGYYDLSWFQLDLEIRVKVYLTKPK